MQTVRRLPCQPREKEIMPKQLEVEIEVKNFDGYKPAFKGAMQAYGILAVKSARWLQHVTGTGGDSVEHYWKDDCETCKEIAEFISEWIDTAEQSVQTDGSDDIKKYCNCPDGYGVCKFCVKPIRRR